MDSLWNRKKVQINVCERETDEREREMSFKQSACWIVEQRLKPRPFTLLRHRDWRGISFNFPKLIIRQSRPLHTGQVWGGERRHDLNFSIKISLFILHKLFRHYSCEPPSVTLNAFEETLALDKHYWKIPACKPQTTGRQALLWFHWKEKISVQKFALESCLP